MFELMPAGTGWSERSLYLFCSQSSCADGASPHAGLIMDAAGHLFGTTNGVAGIPGTFFKLAFTGTGWTETVLHSFSGTDGIEPSSTPLMDAAGNFYGTTYQGGNSNNAGVVFALTPAAPTALAVSLLGPGTADRAAVRSP